MPYDPKSDLETQVKASLAVSLKNLRTEYIDSLVLHSPLKTLNATLAVWRVFESFVNEGKVHYIGLSNCYSPEFFISLYEQASIKPKFLQNRFYQ